MCACGPGGLGEGNTELGWAMHGAFRRISKAGMSRSIKLADGHCLT